MTRIVGVDRDAQALERAASLGVIDTAAESASEAEAGADLVFVSVPVRAIGSVLHDVALGLGPDAVVTDAGSTKADVVRTAEAELRDRLPRFVPGHPIAGRESSGVEAAVPDLFRGARVVLTPEAVTSPEATALVRACWEACGARVTAMPAAAHDQARWSRDGKWIYFASDRTGRSEVWKMPANGGTPAQVTKGGGAAAYESADGKALYYAKDFNFPTSLWQVPTAGGAETQVLESLSYSFNFAVVEEGIYFVSARGQREPGALCFFDFSTRALKQLAPVSLWSWGFAISDDHRSILYSQFDRSGADLMLVENFR